MPFTFLTKLILKKIFDIIFISKEKGRKNMEKWMVAPSYANAEILKIDEKAKKAYIKEKCPRCGLKKVKNGFN